MNSVLRLFGVEKGEEVSSWDYGNREYSLENLRISELMGKISCGGQKNVKNKNIPIVITAGVGDDMYGFLGEYMWQREEIGSDTWVNWDEEIKEVIYVKPITDIKKLPKGLNLKRSRKSCLELSSRLEAFNYLRRFSK